MHLSGPYGVRRSRARRILAWTLLIDLMVVGRVRAGTDPGWYGFNCAGLACDREPELAARCADPYTRVGFAVPGNTPNDLCGALGLVCVRVCDFEGRTQACDERPPSNRPDAVRLAYCAIPGTTPTPKATVPATHTATFTPTPTPTPTATPEPASAGRLLWQPAGLGGGTITCLQADSQRLGTVYAGTSSDGVFKTTDGGTNWKRTSLHGLAVRRLAVAPQETSTLYAATSAGVLLSTDGGRGWTQAAALAGEVLSLAVDPSLRDTVYVGGTFGACTTTDGGRTWQTTSAGIDETPVRALVATAAPSVTIYAVAGRRLFRSTDGARNWTALSDPAGYDLLGVAFDAGPVPTMYATTWNAVLTLTDLGAWTTVLHSSLVNEAVILSGDLVVDERNPGTVYALGDAVYKATAGTGSTAAGWAAFRNGLPPAHVDGAFIKALVIDGQDARTLYAGTESGLFKSSNGGERWASAGLPAGGVTAVAAGSGGSSARYAGTATGVFVQRGGETSWSGLGSPGTTVRVLAPHASDPQGLWAGTDAGLYMTAIGSTGWTRAALPPTTVAALATDPRVPTRLYAGTDVGVFRSDDEGRSWEWTALRNTLVRSLLIAGPGGQTVYAATEFGGFRTTDGGGRWTGLALPQGAVTALAMRPRAVDTLYAATDTGVYKTTDGGVSWTDRSAGLAAGTGVDAVVVDPRAADTVFVACGGRVYVSTDGASTWQAMSDGLTDGVGLDTLMLDPRLPVTLYGGTHPGTPTVGLFALQQVMPCVGACRSNGSGPVGIDDIVLGVSVALGSRGADECPVLDVDWDGAVTVDELLTAVQNALYGCPR